MMCYYLSIRRSGGQRTIAYTAPYNVPRRNVNPDYVHNSAIDTALDY